MEKPTETNPPSSVNPPNPALDSTGQLELGGADAVEKTTYVADVHGAGVNDAEEFPVELTATVARSPGLGIIGWILVVAAVIVFLAYAAGLIT